MALHPDTAGIGAHERPHRLVAQQVALTFPEQQSIKHKSEIACAF